MLLNTVGRDVLALKSHFLGELFLYIHANGVELLTSLLPPLIIALPKILSACLSNACLLFGVKCVINLSIFLLDFSLK